MLIEWVAKIGELRKIALGRTLIVLLVAAGMGLGRATTAMAQLRAASPCDSILIKHIVLNGNRKTKNYIIYREMDFKAGDVIALADSNLYFAKSRNRIFNTRLFVTVDLTLVPLSFDTSICPKPVLVEVEVKERWYLFPTPILELADRSFNEWIYNQGASFRRVNFGLRTDLYNVRGRNETARLTLQGGFTTKLELKYSIPYIDKALKGGLQIGLLHANNRSAPLSSEGNKQSFLGLFTKERSFYRNAINLAYTRRSGFYMFQGISAAYHQNRIADSLAIYRPDYFLNGRKKQRFVSLAYTWLYDKRDIRQYPLHGYWLRATVERLGLLPGDDVDLTALTGGAAHYADYGAGFYSAHSVEGTISGPKRQPYAQTKFLGFGQNFVRGYEKYVLEGHGNVVLKNTLRYRLVEGRAQMRAMPLNQFKVLPYAIYFKIYGDAGYVDNPDATETNRRLLNKWLGGVGAGFDIVTFYDYVLRLEYSVNRQREAGFFLNVAAEI